MPVDLAAPADVVAELRRCYALANRYVVCEIEQCADEVRLDGAQWWDLRPMLNPNEQPQEFIDMNRECIDWALEQGLTVRHPQHAHLVRIVRGAQL